MFGLESSGDETLAVIIEEVLYEPLLTMMMMTKIMVLMLLLLVCNGVCLFQQLSEISLSISQLVTEVFIEALFTFLQQIKNNSQKILCTLKG